MATAFAVLADPHRRQLLDLLRSGERPVGELVDQLGLSQPGVSKHLRVLREAGLVTVRHEAQRRWYGLCPSRWPKLMPGLRRIAPSGPAASMPLPATWRRTRSER
jgi:DNA-binding transcriptional ArsR family regulator